MLHVCRESAEDAGIEEPERTYTELNNYAIDIDQADEVTLCNGLRVVCVRAKHRAL